MRMLSSNISKRMCSLHGKAISCFTLVTVNLEARLLISRAVITGNKTRPIQHTGGSIRKENYTYKQVILHNKTTPIFKSKRI